MAKEWGSRNERELWRDHNLEDSQEFIWPDGERGVIIQRMSPRVYKVTWGANKITRVVTEAFILGCLEHHGDPLPETNLYYSAWPSVKDVRRSQNFCVKVLAIIFGAFIIACVVLVLVVAPSLQ